MKYIQKQKGKKLIKSAYDPPGNRKKKLIKSIYDPSENREKKIDKISSQFIYKKNI